MHGATLIADQRDKPVVKFRFVMIIPLLTILMAIGFHTFYNFYLLESIPMDNREFLNTLEILMYGAIVAGSVFWIIAHIITQITNYFISTSYASTHHILNIVVRSCAKMMKGIALIVVLNVYLQNLHLSTALSFYLTKSSSILVICAFGWILYQLIISAEQLLVHKYTSKNTKAFNSRKIVTQILITKRIALVIISILVVGSILMLFDSVRTLGASVLTTAGIFGIVVTFTAQKTLSSLLAGLEIALTQSIKIGDAVVIENEFGTIEEINFRSVVIKLWDWRRLIVPTSQFLDKPFQNWSREESNNLIGSIYLYIDYTLPVGALRDELTRILANSTLWDGNVNVIQVSDLQNNVMQLRILSSAESPGKAWDLRCEVREKLIAFIVAHYPQCLPMSRSKAFKEVSSEQEAFA